MNCPKCRRYMYYEATLSSPNAKSKKDKKLCYFCTVCGTLYIFMEIDTKTAIGGRLVMSIGKLKRASFSDRKDPAYSSTEGGLKIHQGLVSDLKKNKQ